MNIADADRVVLTTFDASGTATSSAEFVVSLGEDRIGLWSPHATRWGDRLTLSDVVSIQAADRAGRALRSEPVFEGRAELVSEGAEVEAAEKLTRDKYGFAATLADVVDKAWEIGGTKSPHGVIVVHIVG